MNVKELGEYLYLDSGTLSPLVKKLEVKGFITRKRSNKDERNLIVEITEKGESLKEQAVEIPVQIASCTNLSEEEATLLHQLLYKILGEADKEEKY